MTNLPQFGAAKFEAIPVQELKEGDLFVTMPKQKSLLKLLIRSSTKIGEYYGEVGNNFFMLTTDKRKPEKMLPRDKIVYRQIP
jgi:hypothetical protein